MTHPLNTPFSSQPINLRTLPITLIIHPINTLSLNPHSTTPSQPTLSNPDAHNHISPFSSFHPLIMSCPMSIAELWNNDGIGEGEEDSLIRGKIGNLADEYERLLESQLLDQQVSNSRFVM